MGKIFNEFTDTDELNSCLKYWSNACGDLHHRGEYDLDDVSQLPVELQRAYTELWKEGGGCYEYLIEYDEKYYVALVNEFDDSYADDLRISMDELYDLAKKNALKLYQTDIFKNTVLIIGKNTGFDDCHEVFFLVPAMESVDMCNKIRYELNKHIYETS